LGPGAYETKTSFENALVRRQFKQTASRGVAEKKVDNDPGPGSYSPDDRRSRLSMPRYGFGTEKKTRKVGKSNNPGPNSYRINDRVTMRTQASWGMGYGQKVDLSKTLADTPGPGSYVGHFA